jgi:hypothetical protein
MSRSLVVALAYAVAAVSEVTSQTVVSAQVTNLDLVPERNRIDVTMTNTGQRAITAFYLQAFAMRDGVKTPCGGRGQDMIDGSDPMPGTQILVHVARHWIAPGQDRKMDIYPGNNCRQLPLGEVRFEVADILFDDGTGEGSGPMMDLALRVRKMRAAERLKWLPAFSALHQASDLTNESLKLYQAIVLANYTADLDPGLAAEEASAKTVRTELENMALAIHEWAAHSPSPAKLEQNQMLNWRLIDLEQRTARLAKGAGL